jgi:hypothetical protein
MDAERYDGGDVGSRSRSGRALADDINDRLAEFARLAKEAEREGRTLRGPDFLIIGPPKTGTSWLKRALRGHGGIFAPDEEPCYFSHNLHRPISAYLEELAGCVHSRADQFIVGEKSPPYLAMSDERIALCAALFPKAKLVCTVRDPVERAWSQIRHSRPSGYDLPLLHTKASGVGLSDLLWAGFYKRHLRRWVRVFPQSRLLLIDHSRILAEPKAVYREVLDFLGAPIRPLDSSVRSEASPPEQPPAELRAFLEARYQGQIFTADQLKRAISPERMAVLDAASAGAGAAASKP